MLRMTYINTAKEPMSAAELDILLAKSRTNNAACGVSGLLVSDGLRFVQYLEGETKDVMATFERIRSDPRHHAIVVLDRGEGQDRQFGEWSMAYRPAEGIAEFEPLAPRVAALVENCDARTVAELLGFAELRDRSAAA